MDSNVNELTFPATQSKQSPYISCFTKYLAKKLRGSIILIDCQENIIGVSEEFLKLTNQTELSILGHSLANFTTKMSSHDTLTNQIKSLVTGQAAKVKFSCTWKNGNNKIELLLELFSPEDKEGVIPIFVTELEEKSPYFAENSDFKPILESLGIVVWHSSVDVNDIYYVSPGFEKYYEIKFEEYIKDPLLLINRVHPDDKENMLKIYDPSDDVIIRELVFRYYLNDGSWRYIYLYRFPVYDEEGDVSSVVGIAIDNTPLHQAQEEMKFHQQGLATANSNLRAINEMLEDFTAFACHDLSEPLRTFKFYTETLAKNYLQNLDEDGQLILNAIDTATQRMEGLIAGINTFFLTNRDLQETPLLNINDLIEKTLKPIYTSTLNPTCTIEASKLHPLHINKKHMTTLLQNLISNSIKYNNNFPHIKIRSKEFKSSIVYTITDNGIGIPQEMHEKIFQLGKRLNEKPNQLGVGIGLFACKKVMSLYDGLIWVHSKPKEGATFYLLFPK